MQNKSILNNDLQNVCSFESGKRVLNLISAAEQSAYSEERKWIRNEENM